MILIVAIAREKFVLIQIFLLIYVILDRLALKLNVLTCMVEEIHMRISYNKLWKMLIDKEMNRQDLKEAAGISSASISKLGKGANITTDVLLKICEALDCKLEDIMETIVD